MVVDDDETLLASLSSILRREGYEVVPETRVDPALARLGSEDFDILVVDLALGNRSGEELLYFLGVSLRKPPRKVIFITGHPQKLESNEFRNEFTVLAKPFTHEDLLAEIRSA